LSQERREGTLGLLYLTSLKGYDIIIGKLIATSLHAFYGLLAVLPMLSLPLLIGGVSAGQFWRVTLALVFIMLLSLSIGMLISSLCRDTRTALGTSLLLLVLLAGGPPAFWSIAKGFGLGAWPDGLLFLSPGYLYGQAQDVYVGSAVRIARFKLSLMVTVAITFLCLLGASVWPRHAWQDQPEAPTTGRTRTRRAWRFVSRREPGILDDANPCYWLFYRDRQPERIAGLLMSVFFLIWLCCVPGTFSPQWRINNPSFSLLMFIAFGCHFFLKVYIAIEASRRLNEDRRSGALELLLSTPVTVNEIMSAQIRALRDKFNVPLVILGCLNGAMLVLLTVVNPMRLGGEERTVLEELYLGGLILLFLDVRAISWVGMLMGFKNRKHHWAIFKTVGIVILIPWICVFFFIMLGQGRGPIGNMTAWVTVYIMLTAGYNLLLGSGTKQTLAGELRESAAFPTHLAPVAPQLA
jgi:hypothetical protein